MKKLITILLFLPIGMFAQEIMQTTDSKTEEGTNVYAKRLIKTKRVETKDGIREVSNMKKLDNIVIDENSKNIKSDLPIKNEDIFKND